MNANGSPTLAAALAYAPRGWAVLQIRRGSRVSLSADGVKDTSKEEGRTL